MNAILHAPVFTPDQIADLARAESKVIEGRSCGSCAMCCKVLRIAEISKPAGKWCQHCKPGKGCGIHAMRPFVCRGFYCEWIISKGLGPEWKPDRSKFLLSKSGDGTLTASVDTGYPSAWRASPYYENFKIWAAEGVRKNPMTLVFVMHGEHLTVVLPDRDVEFGVLAPGEFVQVNRDASGVLSAEKIFNASDERAQAAI